MKKLGFYYRVLLGFFKEILKKPGFFQKNSIFLEKPGFFQKNSIFMIVCCLKTFIFIKYSFSLFWYICFLLLYQQIVDKLTFPNTNILQIKLMISLFTCSGSVPPQCFGNQDSYMAQFLQYLVQPNATLNEVSEEFSSC